MCGLVHTPAKNTSWEGGGGRWVVVVGGGVDAFFTVEDAHIDSCDFHDYDLTTPKRYASALDTQAEIKQKGSQQKTGVRAQLLLGALSRTPGCRLLTVSFVAAKKGANSWAGPMDRLINSLPQQQQSVNADTFSFPARHHNHYIYVDVFSAAPCLLSRLSIANK